MNVDLDSTHAYYPDPAHLMSEGAVVPYAAVLRARGCRIMPTAIAGLKTDLDQEVDAPPSSSAVAVSAALAATDCDENWLRDGRFCAASSFSLPSDQDTCGLSYDGHGLLVVDWVTA